MKLLLSLCAVINLIGCTSLMPKPTYCLLQTSKYEAVCRDTASNRTSHVSLFELQDKDGWIAVSADDYASMKKFWIEHSERLRRCEGK